MLNMRNMHLMVRLIDTHGSLTLWLESCDVQNMFQKPGTDSSKDFPIHIPKLWDVEILGRPYQTLHITTTLRFWYSKDKYILHQWLWGLRNILHHFLPIIYSPWWLERDGFLSIVRTKNQQSGNERGLNWKSSFPIFLEMWSEKSFWNKARAKKQRNKSQQNCQPLLMVGARFAWCEVFDFLLKTRSEQLVRWVFLHSVHMDVNFTYNTLNTQYMLFSTSLHTYVTDTFNTIHVISRFRDNDLTF